MFGVTRRYYRDVTKYILVLRNLSLYRRTCKYYKTYTGTSYLILVLQNLFLSYGSYTCFTEHVLVFQILYLYYRTCTCILDKEVPVGTTEHFTCTKVPVGTPEQIQRYQNMCRGTRRYFQIFTIFILVLIS